MTELNMTGGPQTKAVVSLAGTFALAIRVWTNPTSPVQPGSARSMPIWVSKPGIFCHSSILYRYIRSFEDRAP